MFVKGQSGNPKGRVRRKTFEDHLREELASRKGAMFKALVQRLYGKAISGDVNAIKLIFERLGGKPKTVELATATETQTLEQVRQQLAVLLEHPDMKKTLESLMKPEPEATIQ